MLKAICKTCNKEFSYYKSVSTGKYCSKACSFADPEWRKRQSESHKGKKWSEEAKKRMSVARKGIRKSDEHRRKIGESQRGKLCLYETGEKSRWWKGGVTEKYYGIRKSREYRRWRNDIMKRDGFKCVLCGSTDDLCVDHLIPFAFLVKESEILNDRSGLFRLENGRVLCNKCHIKTSSYNQKEEYQLECRLLNVISALWKKSYPDLDLRDFYLMQIEKFINLVKEKLE